MKRNTTILTLFTLLAVLISFSANASAPADVAPSSTASDQLMAGGFTDDMPQEGEFSKEGKAGAKASGKGAMGLDEMRKRVRNSDRRHGSAKAPKVSSELMGDYLSGGLTDEFFKDKLVPVTHKQLYETAGYLDGNLDSLGELVDGERSAQVAFSITDEVYFNRGLRDGIKNGDHLIVLHASKDDVSHPVTKEPMGRKVVVDGVIKVVDAKDKNSKAIIIRAYDSIQRGDKVAPYSEPVIPGVDPDSPVKNKNIDGYLVASKSEREGYAQGDVVYLDVGASAGVEMGDVFNIIDSDPVLNADGSKMSEFDKIIGKARIISARDKTSSAFIFASKGVILAGDKVKFSPTRYQ